jgi:hypothetical protein
LRHNIDWVAGTTYCPDQNVASCSGYQRHSNPADLIALSEVSFHTFEGGTALKSEQVAAGT